MIVEPQSTTSHEPPVNAPSVPHVACPDLSCGPEPDRCVPSLQTKSHASPVCPAHGFSSFRLELGMARPSVHSLASQRPKSVAFGVFATVNVPSAVQRATPTCVNPASQTNGQVSPVTPTHGFPARSELATAAASQGWGSHPPAPMTNPGSQLSQENEPAVLTQGEAPQPPLSAAHSSMSSHVSPSPVHSPSGLQV